MDDKRIVALLWKRAEEALEALAQKYGQGLHRLAMNILGDHHDAQECVNDTYLALWNAIPPASPDPLAPYAYRTGRNTALKRLRSDTAAKRSRDYDIPLEELAECIGGAEVEEKLDARELGRAIDTFLDTLPQSSRVLFLRRYWFGDSIREAAQLCGIQENAACVRLSRIRSKLKDHLLKEGLL